MVLFPNSNNTKYSKKSRRSFFGRRRSTKQRSVVTSSTHRIRFLPRIRSSTKIATKNSNSLTHIPDVAAIPTASTYDHDSNSADDEEDDSWMGDHSVPAEDVWTQLIRQGDTGYA